jgi:enoyl-CoA hydratase
MSLPRGGAREKAEELAREIARFPQVCVRADRRSAIKSHGLSVREALIQEWYNGREALIEGFLNARTVVPMSSGS